MFRKLWKAGKRFVLLRSFIRSPPPPPKKTLSRAWKTPQNNCLFSSRLFFRQYHGQKSWDTLAFLGGFPIHRGPTPPLTNNVGLMNPEFFSEFQLYRVGGGRTARKFLKGCTILWGNRETTEKYEYCSTVPRTFVHAGVSLSIGDRRILRLLSIILRLNFNEVWPFFIQVNKLWIRYVNVKRHYSQKCIILALCHIPK